MATLMDLHKTQYTTFAARLDAIDLAERLTREAKADNCRDYEFCVVRLGLQKFVVQVWDCSERPSINLGYL